MICMVTLYVSAQSIVGGEPQQQQQRSSVLGFRRGSSVEAALTVPVLHTKAQIHACISIVCGS